MRREVKDVFKCLATSHYLVTHPVVWSKNGSKFLFLAERVINTELKPEQEFGEQVLNKFQYQHTLGEGHSKFYNLDVYVVDVEAKTLSKLSGTPDDLVLLYPSFIGDQGDALLLQGIDSTKFVSGLAFCNNKPSSIFVVNDPKYEIIAEKKDKKTDEPSQIAEKSQFKKVSDEPIALMPFSSPSGSQICYLYSHVYKEQHK